MDQNPCSRIELVDKREYQKVQMKPTKVFISKESNIKMLVGVAPLHLSFPPSGKQVFYSINRPNICNKVYHISKKKSSLLILQTSFLNMKGKSLQKLYKIYYCLNIQKRIIAADIIFWKNSTLTESSILIMFLEIFFV